MMFWLIIFLATLAVLVLLLRPWSRTRGADVSEVDDGLRISIYQQNLRELDREFERGQLNRDQLANVRNELELSLLAEIERDKVLNGSGHATASRQSSHFTAVIPVVLLVVLAIPLYLYIGNPQLNELKQFSRLAAEGEGGTPPPLDGVVPVMQRHLHKNPRDANGWLLLSDMYSSMQDYTAAVNAIERLYQITGDDPDVMLRYANALIMANNGKFSGKPAELAQRVLELEPANYTALLFAGMAEDEAANYQQANEYYKKLLPALQANPQLLQTINQLIARNEQLLRDAGGADSASESTAETQAANLNTASLRVGVRVSSDLAGQYRPEDTLFIYAQAIDGPPMPLAVSRNKAGELPIEVTLDDSMAMMPAMKLSAFTRVKLQARISRTGNAQPESGDLVGLLAEVDVSGTESINLVIDTVLP